LKTDRNYIYFIGNVVEDSVNPSPDTILDDGVVIMTDSTGNWNKKYSIREVVANM
jgi:hypothetical protein